MEMKSKIISYVLGSEQDLAIHENSFEDKIYLRMHNRFSCSGKGNYIDLGSRVKNCTFDISGTNNKIVIGKNCNIHDVFFGIYGNHNSIVIGNNVSLRTSHFQLGDNHSRLRICDLVSIEKDAFICVLEGKLVKIGNECMFSTGIIITPSDAHPIFELKTGERINRAKNILIGEHVWFGQNVTCLKGVEISDNVIIGNGSLCTAGKYKSGCIYAGNPAKLIKEGYYWEVKRQCER